MSILIDEELIDRLGGDHAAAALLTKLKWWFTPKADGSIKVRVRRDGKFWVANTREEWMKDLGLTLKRYKRVRNRLLSLGLIEIKLMKFKGITQTHIRLVEEALDGPKGTTGLGQKGPTASGPNGAALNTCETTCKTYMKTSADALPEKTLEGEANPAGEVVLEKAPELGKASYVKAEEVLAAKKAKPVLNGSLEVVWKSAVALATPEYQKQLNQKQRGQLKHLANAIGPDTKPVIRFAVEHWTKFGHRAVKEKALEDFPTYPDVGFLLAHYEVAVRMLQSIAKPESAHSVAGSAAAATASSPSADGKPTTQVEEKSTQVEVEPATPEELELIKKLEAEFGVTV